MIDSECNTGGHNSSKISIGAVIKNPEMLKFVPDYLKIKQMCNLAVKKLSFIIRYVSDQYKTEKIYDKLLIVRFMH